MSIRISPLSDAETIGSVGYSKKHHAVSKEKASIFQETAGSVGYLANNGELGANIFDETAGGIGKRNFNVNYFA